MDAKGKIIRNSIGGLIVLTAPLYLGDYFLYIVSLTIVYILASFGTNILSGYTNLLSLAGATFFASGAFATAIFMGKLGLKFLARPALSGDFCGHTEVCWSPCQPCG